MPLTIDPRGMAVDSHILIIGAGLAGLGMGAQLKRLLCHNNFTIFDKCDDVGGTWAQNTYPNLSCDVPSEYYSFSFFQNPDWSEKFASQPEILAYLHDYVRHFALEPHLRLRMECLSLHWSSKLSQWTALFKDLDKSHEFELHSKYVITAMGVLNIPKGLDDLPLLAGFGGAVFHTSQWQSVDFDGKDVLIVGNGCSANQVIPWMLNERKPRQVTQIARSAQWVAPKGNTRNSSAFRCFLRYVPLAMQIYRWWTAYQLDSAFLTYYKDPAGDRAREKAAKGIRNYMRSTAKPKYHDILIPDYDFGAKRPVMDHGYLAATNLENFELIQCDGLTAIEGEDSRVLVDKAGNRHHADIVIMANGFQTQDLLTPMAVYGEDNLLLNDYWHERGGSEAYMGVSVSKFPNLFLLAGPNTLPSSNSTLQGIECSIVYITRVLWGLWARNPSRQSQARLEIAPSPSAQAMFNAELQRKMRALVYTQQVSTWYISKDSGKNTLIWPGTQISFWFSRCVRPVKWSDWVISR